MIHFILVFTYTEGRGIDKYLGFQLLRGESGEFLRLLLDVVASSWEKPVYE